MPGLGLGRPGTPPVRGAPPGRGAPGAPGGPLGAAPSRRGAERPMPCWEENGLLPGRGALVRGRGAPGTAGDAGRGAAGPGRGAPGRGGADVPPARGGPSVRAAGASVRAAGASALAAGRCSGAGAGGSTTGAGAGAGLGPGRGAVLAGASVRATTGAGASVTAGRGAGAAGAGPGRAVVDGAGADVDSTGALVGGVTGDGATGAGTVLRATGACGRAGDAVFFGCAPTVPIDSRSLRTTGASTVEDAERTNSPRSESLARMALLSTFISLASS